MSDLAPHGMTLLRLTCTDADPRVCHRNDGLVLPADGMPIDAAAGVIGPALPETQAGRPPDLG